MNPIARFFVNRSSARRTARFYDWVRKEVSLPSNARCLEVGCGNGSLAIRMVEGFHPAEYVATDFDPRQLEQARRVVGKRYPGGPPTALVLRTADMVSLTDPSSSYDVVLAFVAIHHASPSHLDFSRVPQALAEFDRVLRPGGCLVYAELLHREPIRQWLTQHGFTIERFQSRWRLEYVVARKPSAAGGATPVPTSS
jgi:ubiquinone/menaquinone biosynthesis C-methylase UbiE